MKNGMNRLDLRAAAELVSYGWTAPQISQRLKVKLPIVEAWMPTLTPEGWAAYIAKNRKDRELAATAVRKLNDSDMRALAREQILIEEKIRAEIRAEMAEASAKREVVENAREVSQAPQTEKDAGEETPDTEREPDIGTAEDSAPRARRRKRKAPASTDAI